MKIDEYFKQCVQQHYKIMRQQPAAIRDNLVVKTRNDRLDCFFLVSVKPSEVGISFRHDVIWDPQAVLVSLKEIEEYWPLQPIENYERVRDLLKIKNFNEVVFVHILLNTNIVCYGKIEL